MENVAQRDEQLVPATKSKPPDVETFHVPENEHSLTQVAMETRGSLPDRNEEEEENDDNEIDITDNGGV